MDFALQQLRKVRPTLQKLRGVVDYRPKFFAAPNPPPLQATLVTWGNQALVTSADLTLETWSQ